MRVTARRLSCDRLIGAAGGVGPVDIDVGAGRIDDADRDRAAGWGNVSRQISCRLSRWVD